MQQENAHVYRKVKVGDLDLVYMTHDSALTTTLVRNILWECVKCIKCSFHQTQEDANISLITAHERKFFIGLTISPKLSTQKIKYWLLLKFCGCYLLNRFTNNKIAAWGLTVLGNMGWILHLVLIVWRPRTEWCMNLLTTTAELSEALISF